MMVHFEDGKGLNGFYLHRMSVKRLVECCVQEGEGKNKTLKALFSTLWVVFGTCSLLVLLATQRLSLFLSDPVSHEYCNKLN